MGITVFEIFPVYSVLDYYTQVAGEILSQSRCNPKTVSGSIYTANAGGLGTTFSWKFY